MWEWIFGLTLLVAIFIFKRNSSSSSAPPSKSFNVIVDKYKTLEEVIVALKAAGLESSNLILGIDYTKSNEDSGAKSFGGKSLHAISADERVLNPYQQVIEIIGKTLERFDDDKLIPVFGFGDTTTKDKGVFPFFPDRSCNTFVEVLDRYLEITPLITLSGPTNFAPLIRTAIDIVKTQREYHILVIIADGQVINIRDTIDAIVEASNYPLSIIMVGVGDGPWDTMQEFDDALPQRKFDNFQFVNFHEVVDPRTTQYPEANFAANALMEIPEQFLCIRRLGYL